MAADSKGRYTQHHQAVLAAPSQVGAASRARDVSKRHTAPVGANDHCAISSPVSEELPLESGIQLVTATRSDCRHIDHRFFKFTWPAFDNNIVIISKGCKLLEQFPFFHV
jgi:hypothetical protein